MRNKVLIVVQCLLVQAFCSVCGWMSAQTMPRDTLSWSWEVTSTTSTRIKTCVLEFIDSVNVDWGDGTVEWVNDSLSKETLTHTYTGVGNFSCTVIGASLTYFKADSRRLLSLHPEKAPNLVYISCTSSQLTALDLSRNTKLVSLYCGGNDLLTLNLVANTKLETLTCSDNKLTSLDLSGLSQLKKVTCHTNPLTSLSVHPSGALTYLSCSACSLSTESLDVLFEQLPVLPEVSSSKNLYFSGNPGSSACHPELAAAKKWTLETSSTKSIVFIPQVDVKMGDTAVVAVHLTNVKTIVAFEMDISLPEGLVLDTLRTSLVNTRIRGHALSVAQVSASPSVYKLMAYSMTSKDTLIGREGALLTLYISVPDTVRTYTIDIKKVILADTAATTAEVTLSDGKLSVIPRYTLGDADNDDRVNVTDVVWLVALINGRAPSDCQKDAIDMDGNGAWNVLDVVRLVDVINSITYSALAPAGRVSNASSMRVATSSSMLIKEPYNVTTATVDNHLYLNQSLEDPTVLELCLDNNEVVQALQVDIVLPEAVSLVMEETSLSARCAQNHTIKLVPMDADGHRYRALIWSMASNQSFSGNSGKLVSFRIKPPVAESDAGSDTLKGVLDQSVLTGHDMTTLHSLSYETKLNVFGKETPATSSAGSGRNGQLWVRGTSLKRIRVYDLMSLLVADIPCVGETGVITTVRPGCYLVKVEQRNTAVKIFKVLVP